MAEHRGMQKIPNLERDRRAGGKTYFRYRFPDGERRSLGSDRAQAEEAAKALNAHFAAGQVDRLLSRVTATRPSTHDPSLAHAIERYIEERVPQKRWAPRTQRENEWRLATIADSLPAKPVSRYTTLDLAQFLDTLTPDPYRKFRGLLVDLFQFVTHKGWRPDNPAAATLASRGAPVKVRQRHTLERLLIVREASPAWLQRAIDITLRSIQRPQDIVMMHRDQVNLRRGTLRVLQRKSLNWRHPVHLDIEMGPELLEAVRACMSDDVPCPFLVHCRPRRMTRQAREGKPHPFAVTRQHLGREFARYRDLSGAYEDMAPAERPGVHEIRALGSWLYEQAGFSPDYIMALGGWSDQRMLQRYQSNHAGTQPKVVRADLTLG